MAVRRTGPRDLRRLLLIAAVAVASPAVWTPCSAATASPETPTSKGVCSDPATRTRLARCFPSLLVHDAGKVFSAPARWGKREWGFFAAGVVGVGALTLVDDDLRTAVLRGHGGIQDEVARIFEPFGTWAAFATLGGFYVGGVAAHDEKARGAALDGLVASVIAAGVLAPVLKETAGRSRPNAGLGPHDFHPFHGGASFVSGHGTEAFAVASVIATEYPAPWVRAACYVPASLVLYARMRHDAHWASDVAAGALIGYGVGHTVARLNLPLRTGAWHAVVMPLLGRGASGAMLTARF